MITRNPESQAVLSALGVPSELGTDTAWTFEPHPPEYGRKALSDAGWDGSAPVLVVCPIHPFCWPVKASTLKWAAHGVTGAYKESHYRSVYFHKAGAEVDASLSSNTWTRLPSAWKRRGRRHRMFPDSGGHGAAGRAGLPGDRGTRRAGAPVFTSDQYDMYSW